MDKDPTTWIVTGASRGIGLAAADRILDQGGRVALVARGDGLDALAAERGENCIACRADVSRPEELAAVAERVLGEWGRIDVLVNNAGLHRGGRVGASSRRTGRRCWMSTSPAR